jgi:hypothetical protein
MRRDGRLNIKRNPLEKRGPNLKFLWYFVWYQLVYE